MPTNVIWSADKGWHESDEKLALTLDPKHRIKWVLEPIDPLNLELRTLNHQGKAQGT